MTFRAEISGLFIDRKNGEPVLMLKEQDGSRSLPIWIQMSELFSLAIQLSLDAVKLPRPFAHDLIKSVVVGLQARVSQVVITDIEDYIYRSQITVESPERILKFDARPSDAIVLALKFEAPIWIVEEVMERHLALTNQAGLTEDSLRLRLQKLQPKDVINHSA